MSEEHNHDYNLGDGVLFACVPCNLLISNKQEHDLKFHRREGGIEMEQEEAESLVHLTVRLLLPNQVTLSGQFLASDTVASVLAFHFDSLQEYVGLVGPEQEVTIRCEDRVLLPAEFSTPLSSLDRWTWAGEEELCLVYTLRRSHLSKEVDQDQDSWVEFEELVKRLVKTDGAQEENLDEIARILNQDKFGDNSPSVLDPMHSELMLASKHPENPFHFSKFPFDVNEATFLRMIVFSKKNLPITYRWVLELKSDTHQLAGKDVVPIIQMIGDMMRLVSRASGCSKV